MGFPVSEENLSASTRAAITNLATIQRHLSAITELLRGEQNRIDRSLILRTASRLGVDSEKVERNALALEMGKLRDMISVKTLEITSQVLAEEEARRSGGPPPERKGGLEAVQLKCPNCGALLPLPTGRFVKCHYCGTSLSIQDVSSQISSMIQKI